MGVKEVLDFALCGCKSPKSTKLSVTTTRTTTTVLMVTVMTTTTIPANGPRKVYKTDPPCASSPSAVSSTHHSRHLRSSRPYMSGPTRKIPQQRNRSEMRTVSGQIPHIEPSIRDLRSRHGCPKFLRVPRSRRQPDPLNGATPGR